MSDAPPTPAAEVALAGGGMFVPPVGRARLRWGIAVNTALLYAVVALAVVPVAFLLIYSFNAAAVAEPYRLGLDPWLEVFRPANLNAIADSFILSLRIIIGGAAALVISWCLVRLSLPGRRIIETALWFGFFMPTIPVAMAWGLLLDPGHGLINEALAGVPFLPHPVFSAQSIAGIMWVHLSITTVPFLTLIFTPTIRQFDSTFEEVARANGASWTYTVRRITLPLLAPALFAGLIANYIKMFESFEVEQLLGTPAGIYVFATRVYDLVSDQIPRFSEGMALSSLLLVIAVGLALLHHRFNSRRVPAATIGTQGFRSGHAVPAWVRWTISLVFFAFVAVAVVLPVGVVIVGSFAKLFGFLNIPEPWTLAHWQRVISDPRFVRAASNSLLFGVGVAVVSVSLFFWLAWLLVRGRVFGKALAAQLFWLPWALPGFVLGLSILWLMLRFDVAAPLYGTFAPVLLVLAIKELPIGVHFFRVAIEQMSPQLEEAAAVAGAGRLYTFRRVSLPLLAPAVVSVFIIVFIAVVKDVSSIILVAAPGTETASLLLYEFAFTGRTESASVIGVLYALAALFLAVLVSRRAEPLHLR